MVLNYFWDGGGTISYKKYNNSPPPLLKKIVEYELQKYDKNIENIYCFEEEPLLVYICVSSLSFPF